MRNALTISILFLTASASWAQYTFFKAYGNGGYDYCRDMIEDVDSAWVLAGSSSSFGDENAEAYLFKIDSIGDMVWSYNYGGYGTEWANACVLTNDSTYALAGFTNSYGAGGFDFYLVRAGDNGVPLWEKTYGGSDWDKAYDLVQLPDSGFVLVGDTYSFGSGGKKGYMVRTDKFGDTLWTQVFDGYGESFLKGVYLDEAGDSLIVCGGSENNGAGLNGLDGWGMKMDIDGNLGYEFFVGGAYDDYFNDVAGDGTHYALGGSRGYTFPTTEEDIWFMKLDAINGSIVWDTTNSTPSVRSDIVNAVCFRPTVGVEEIWYAAQTSTWGYGSIDADDDFYFGKRNPGGGHVTDQTYGKAGPDAAHAIVYAYDKGGIVAGDTKNYSTGGNNIMVLKMNPWNYPLIEELEYDGVTSSIDQEEKLSLSIFPNPASNALTVVCDKPISSAEAYSMDGRKVGTLDFNDKTLDISNLVQGNYILRLNIEGQEINRRFIKL